MSNITIRVSDKHKVGTCENCGNRDVKLRLVKYDNKVTSFHEEMEVCEECEREVINEAHRLDKKAIVNGSYIRAEKLTEAGKLIASGNKSREDYLKFMLNVVKPLIEKCKRGVICENQLKKLSTDKEAEYVYNIVIGRRLTGCKHTQYSIFTTMLLLLGI